MIFLYSKFLTSHSKCRPLNCLLQLNHYPPNINHNDILIWILWNKQPSSIPGCCESAAQQTPSFVLRKWWEPRDETARDDPDDQQDGEKQWGTEGRRHSSSPRKATGGYSINSNCIHKLCKPGMLLYSLDVHMFNCNGRDLCNCFCFNTKRIDFPHSMRKKKVFLR